MKQHPPSQPPPSQAPPSQAAPSNTPATHIKTTGVGLVTRSLSGFITVHTGDGRTLTCKLRGKLKQERQRSEIAVAGDRVRFEAQSETEGTILEVLPRTSTIMRKEVGPRGAHFDDLIVANLDLLVITGAATAPTLQPGLVDRFLVIAELGHVKPLLVITKCDAPDPDFEAELRLHIQTYRNMGIEVIETSVRTGLGMDTLRTRLEGQISAFMGKSGAGKSSLLNAIDPAFALVVGDVSDALKKGTHTTRVASLHPFGTGWLVDTPGLRELGVPELNAHDLTACFPEMRERGRCKFTTCAHENEKGCVMREGIATGEIAASRIESFRKLLRGEPHGG